MSASCLADVENEVVGLFFNKEYLAVENRIQPLLEQHPDWLNGWKILSDTLLVQGKEAKKAAGKALALNQHDAAEHCYFGLILKAEGDLMGAADSFAKAIELNPNSASAHNNLGIVKKDSGQVPEGITHYQKALKINPDYSDCFSNLLFCLSHYDGIDARTLFKRHGAYSDQYEKPLIPKWRMHRNDRCRDRKLRVGFVSADFREHSVANCLLPLLEHLQNSKELTLFAYYNHSIEDEITRTLQGHFAHWTNINDKADGDVVQIVQEHGIDILVDLSGHTAGNRLRLFAMKPAPIQVSWFGYLATTGLKAMDYYLADAYLAPNKLLDKYFSEKLVKLPVNASFVAAAHSPDISPLPALEKSYVTFGSFNRPSKVSDSTIVQWAALLQAIPTSTLLLGAMARNDSDNTFVTRFAKSGIDESRLIFHARTSLQDYMALHEKVDICLDTQPSSSITPTFFALWMGVPTLCMEAQTLTGRGSMAIMSHLNLTGFVAKDSQDFINKGKYWSDNRHELDQIRQSMRERFYASRLADSRCLSQALEVAFRKMWHIWCKRQSKRSFEVDAQ